MTGLYYWKVGYKSLYLYHIGYTFCVKEIIEPFKIYLTKKMEEKYPDPIERNIEWRKMWWQQGEYYIKHNSKY